MERALAQVEHTPRCPCVYLERARDPFLQEVDLLDCSHRNRQNRSRLACQITLTRALGG
jgi:hypothetical protein